MNRMRNVVTTALLILLGATFVTAGNAARPNILLIVSEDNGQELGCYGDPYVSTPILDKLADQGIRFHNAYVPQAGCSQSRAAYYTGLYPHQNGQIGLATWKFRMYREDTPNLIHRLKSSGYRTGMLGKLHINPESAFPLDMHQIGSSNFARKNLDDYARKAEAFISESDRPFFLSVNYPDAHRPLIPRTGGLPSHPLTAADVKPLRYFGIDTPELRQQTANYYNCISRLDSLIGDLLAALERSGKSDQTIVVYIGDHGADLLRGKRTSYEGGTRVPMIVRWPSHIPTGQVRHQLVSTIDLMPTLLEVSGAEPVSELPGRSLVPLFGSDPGEWREYLFTEYHIHSAHNFYPQRTIRGGRYKLIHNLMPNEENPGYQFTLNRFFSGLAGAIDAADEPIRSAYQRMRIPPQFELYDLVGDPYEFENLADDPQYQVVLDELRQRLADWRRKTRDPLIEPRNLDRLRQEVEACFVDGLPQKSQLKLRYPDYFFASDN